MRRCWFVLGLLAAVLPQWACSQQEKSLMNAASAPLSPEDAALKYRFRNVSGGELYVSGFAQVGPAALYEENGSNYHSIATWFDKNGGGIRSSYGGAAIGDQLVIPKTLRVIRYAEDARIKGNATPFSAFDGAVARDVTVPVASRIPDELLEDLRRDPKGVLRLKLRIHPDTLLVGWDIERRPGFDPKKRDQFGEAVYVAPVHSFAGGDFREAKIFNGQVVRKGWYIDPKTGQKIETDF
jgi:hypothetical protein